MGPNGLTGSDYHSYFIFFYILFIVMEIKKDIRQNINKHRLFNWGDKVLIAVSGGPDSVALLHILHDMAPPLGLTLYIAHVNHHLRRSAQKDEEFVAKMSRELHCPFYPISLNNIKSMRGSLEEAARIRRYEALCSLSKKEKLNCIAVGHTQDDLAETVLMRILRGTGLLGLQGMRPKRRMHGVDIVRPLLRSSRRDILSYLKKNKIAFRIDPSNRQKIFWRNKIRLDLLPDLEKNYNPKIKATLAHLADITCYDYDFLESETKKLFKKISRGNKKDHICLRTNDLKKLHPSQMRMIVRFAIETLQKDTRRLTLNHMGEIEDLIFSRPPQSTVDLPKRVSIVKNRSQVVFKICP